MSDRSRGWPVSMIPTGPDHGVFQADLTADPEKAMLPKFARAYNVDAGMLAAAGGDRYTITFRPRRIVVNPRQQA